MASKMDDTKTKKILELNDLLEELEEKIRKELDDLPNYDKECECNRAVTIELIGGIYCIRCGGYIEEGDFEEDVECGCNKKNSPYANPSLRFWLCPCPKTQTIGELSRISLRFSCGYR